MNIYQDIQIQPLSSASNETRYLIGCNGTYYEASATLVKLIEALKTHNTLDRAVESFMHNCDKKYTKEQICNIVRKHIEPVLISNNKRKQFLYQRQLLSTTQIDAFSDKLSILFNRYVMWGILLAVTISDIYFFINTSDLLTFSNKINAFIIFALIIFIIVSSLFHELGHASACKHFGVRHGGIGFGLYINFPVLYTDVTNVWQLPRRKRIVVNIAGVYFQCMILALLIIGFFIGSSAFLVGRGAPKFPQ